MASLQTLSIILPLSSSSSSPSSAKKAINAAIHLPKNFPSLNLSSLPKIPSSNSQKLQIQDLTKFTHTIPPLHHNVILDDDPFKSINSHSKPTIQLYAILEAISDRIEMHNNIAHQRDNWNTLLLNSTNMITLAATTMAAIAAATGGAGVIALKLSSTLLFSAATGISLIMNKIQPSQLAEEQRNATRLLKQLRTEIETIMAIGEAKEEDVNDAMEKVLALDRAFPLPLLGGAMLEKFPSKFEPAVWWPQRKNKSHIGKKTMEESDYKNGWSEELEKELREVIEVVKTKDIEDYHRLGNLALKLNKILAMSGPLLTGIAAVGSAFVGKGSLVDIVPLVAGSLAAAVNTVEHGGQVGMVLEMYRNCGGFFVMLENWIEEEKREIVELKMALRLGRSVSQLRQLASKSESCRREGIEVDEFGSKLF